MRRILLSKLPGTRTAVHDEKIPNCNRVRKQLREPPHACHQHARSTNISLWPELNKTVFWGGFCGVPG